MDSPPPLPGHAGPPAPEESWWERYRHGLALARGHRLVEWGLALLLVFGFVTAAVVLLDPLALDVPITRAVQRVDLGPLEGLPLAVNAPGFWPWNVLFPLAIILALALLQRIAEAGFLALATVLTATDELVKAVVQRVRPSADLVHVWQPLQSYSFPSGHVTEYTLVFGFCFYLAFTLLARGRRRSLLLLFTGSMVLLVGPARIWVGQHWASDVVGAYTLGLGLLLLVIWAYRGWEARVLTRQGPAA
jgi:membrane-associated phospholipid phosphatase